MVLHLNTHAHRVNPYAQRKYDGINLNPMEVMFIKVKDYVLANDWEAARTAVKYATWQDEQVRVAVQQSTQQHTLLLAAEQAAGHHDKRVHYQCMAFAHAAGA